MKNLMLRLIRVGILFRKFKNFKGAWFLSAFPGNHRFDHSVDLKWTDDKLYFPASGNFLRQEDLHLLNIHLDVLIKLDRRFIFEKDNDKLIFKIRKNNKDITILADSDAIVFAINEIFNEELYDFADPKNYVFIDIGMNRGLASLFLASFDNILHVHGYEPFEQTHQLALDNFSLNPLLKNKITSSCLAWSNAEQVLQISLKAPGFLGASITNIPVTQAEERNLVEINTVKASDEFNKIICNIDNSACIGIKMDCEGAEYDIIKDLDDSGLLGKVKMIMMEWHDLGKEPIVEILQKNNFYLFAPNRNEDTPMGMIYGVNTAI